MAVPTAAKFEMMLFFYINQQVIQEAENVRGSQIFIWREAARSAQATTRQAANNYRYLPPAALISEG